MKRIFIINPNAGNGKAKELVTAIQACCLQENLDYQIYYTKDPKEAITIVRKESEPSIIYSVGGDGTLNGVINGIVKTKHQLSIIPAGTGNDFYRSLTFDTTSLDIGKVNHQYFVNIASIGIDAEVAKKANWLKEQNKANKTAYVQGLLRVFPTYHPKKVRINQEEKTITLLAVCNGQYYGNGFHISKTATVDDGYLQLCMAEGLSKSKILYLLLHLLKGTVDTKKEFQTDKIKSLHIASSTPLVCNVDGEILEQYEYHFSLVPNAVPLYQEDQAAFVRLKSLCQNRRK